MSSILVGSQPKASYEKLRKTPEGSNNVKWPDKLKEDFASNSAVSVTRFGPDLSK